MGQTASGEYAVVVLTESAGVDVPPAVDGVPLVVQVTGRIWAFPKPEGKGKPPKGEDPAVDPTASFDRPVPIGVSTGHPAITDGTDVFALSNNHVYADANDATVGDAVIQPGTVDGGTSPADDIGTLFDFEPIKFDGSDNTIDAAIALSSTANLGNATPSDGYGTPKSATVTASINQKVKKYGRTTGLTKGQVYLINATVDVCYEADANGNCTKLAKFVDQTVITPEGFSGGGDSGSLIVADGKGRNKADDRKPVGLLFAGSALVTIANPIDAVLGEFDVTIDGE